MKKLIIFSALLAANFANADAIRIVQKNKDGTSVTNEYNAIEYAQKSIADKSVCPNPKAWGEAPAIIFSHVQDSETATAVDRILSEGYFYVQSADYASKYPLLFANYAKVYSDTIPEVVPVIKSILANPKAQDCKVKDAVIRAYIGFCKTKSLVGVNVRYLLNVAPFGIRHQIRSEGKSFVTKGGINPVQERIDHLTAALNAPRLSGINKAMDECGIRFGLDFTKPLLNQEEVDQLRTDVLNGYINFSPDIVSKLRTHLGIDEYNKFVKLYNEGE